MSQSGQAIDGEGSSHWTNNKQFVVEAAGAQKRRQST